MLYFHDNISLSWIYRLTTVSVRENKYKKSAYNYILIPIFYNFAHKDDKTSQYSSFKHQKDNII